MNKTPWNDVKKAIRDQAGSTPPMIPAETFWSDFKARARLRHRETAAAPRRIPIPRLALATACAIVAVAVVGTYVMMGPAAPPTNRIQSLEVKAAHSAVLIMDDETSDGTIVWVVDMEKPDGGSENSI
jgi:hypothetical protein